ncbi:CD63 antigen [Orchesella cincta]|uniref:CD63 antigen n=1 Tax=Orchesella cincta TaxID=48709 RepID=A0A1D2M937_ORCCI|nr:CD63 antigen [Orchesella cincta]
MFPRFRIDRATLFYYITHVLGCILAVTIILLAFFTRKAEQDTIGDFDIHLSTPFVILFYISATCLILAIGVGYLAQKLSDKPSLWILYCILLSLISLVMLTASISSYSKASSNEAPKLLKNTMEFYVKGNSDSVKWDDLHKRFECCGTKGYKDWQDVQFGRTSRTSLRVPQSKCG